MQDQSLSEPMFFLILTGQLSNKEVQNFPNSLAGEKFHFSFDEMIT